MKPLDKILEEFDEEYAGYAKKTIDFMRKGQASTYRIGDLSNKLGIPEEAMIFVVKLLHDKTVLYLESHGTGRANMHTNKYRLSKKYNGKSDK